MPRSDLKVNNMYLLGAGFARAIFEKSPLNDELLCELLKFLLTHEASMSEREIASILKVSHMAINRTMKDIAKLNFVNFVCF